jgi:hypothetical protein
VEIKATKTEPQASEAQTSLVAFSLLTSNFLLTKGDNLYLRWFSLFLSSRESCSSYSFCSSCILHTSNFNSGFYPHHNFKPSRLEKVPSILYYHLVIWPQHAGIRTEAFDSKFREGLFTASLSEHILMCSPFYEPLLTAVNTTSGDLGVSPKA